MREKSGTMAACGGGGQAGEGPLNRMSAVGSDDQVAAGSTMPKSVSSKTGCDEGAFNEIQTARSALESIPVGCRSAGVGWISSRYVPFRCTGRSSQFPLLV